MVKVYMHVHVVSHFHVFSYTAHVGKSICLLQDMHLSYTIYTSTGLCLKTMLYSKNTVNVKLMLLKPSDKNNSLSFYLFAQHSVCL